MTMTSNLHLFKLRFFLIFISVCVWTTSISAKNWDFADISEKLKLKSVSKPKIFKGEDLFNHINGGAVVYLSTGFKHATFTKFKSITGTRINLEIFEMNSPDSAQKIFTLKAGQEKKAKDIGKGNVLKDYYCLFWQGPYFVMISLSTSQVLAEDKEILEKMANLVAVMALPH